MICPKCKHEMKRKTRHSHLCLWCWWVVVK